MWNISDLDGLVCFSVSVQTPSDGWSGWKTTPFCLADLGTYPDFPKLMTEANAKYWNCRTSLEIRCTFLWQKELRVQKTLLWRIVGWKALLSFLSSCNSLDLLVLFEAFFVTKEVLETVASSGWKACFGLQKSCLAFAGCLMMYGRGWLFIKEDIRTWNPNPSFFQKE